MIREELLYSENFGGVPESLKEFIAELNNQLGRIPEDLRDTATISFEIFIDTGRIVIRHERPETEEEKRIRERIDRNRAEATKIKELNELKRLKAKYEETI